MPRKTCNGVTDVTRALYSESAAYRRKDHMLFARRVKALIHAKSVLIRH